MLFETVDTIARVFNNNLILNVLLVPLLLCCCLYFFFKKKSEFSYHAIQNSAATLLLGCLNYGTVLLCYEEISGFVQAGYDLLRIPSLPADFWDGWPFWLVCLIGLVTRDFADYWNHRIMHTRWGWPSHAAHHSDTHVNAFTTYRVHFFEAVLMSSSYILLLSWLQMPEAIPAVVMFGALHNMYVHMDLPFTHGPFKFLIASPVFHRWHHADTPEAYGKNLANVIPAWDLIFGTYHCPAPCTVKMGAVDSGIEDKNPVLIFLYPLLQWSRMIRRRVKRLADKSRAPHAGAPGQTTAK